MTERLVRFAPLGLLVVLGVVMLLPVEVALRNPESPDADQLRAVLDEVPPGSSVLVGFDPDLGTYAEIRPTVRALLDELLERGTTLSVVSLTPEGRALALAELERARRLDPDAAFVDRGFLPGAEAALVRIATAIETPLSIDDDPEPMAIDLERPRLIWIVGGNDLGPRSWVEQVLPRTDAVPTIAVTPSVLLPEVAPYRESGQLAALIATPRDGAAFRDALEPGTLRDAADEPSGLAVLAGMLIAIAWLGATLVRRVGSAASLRADRDRA